MPWMVEGDIDVGEEDNVTNVMSMPWNAYPVLEAADFNKLFELIIDVFI